MEGNINILKYILADSHSTSENKRVKNSLNLKPNRVGFPLKSVILNIYTDAYMFFGAFKK